MGNNPRLIDEERGFNPPLGLLYIAAYLEQYTDHHVEVLDTQVEELSYPQLQKIIAEKTPDIVGITAMTFTLIDVLKTIQCVKEIDRNIPIVLGGPHPHIYPQETVELPGVDYVVLGEGEIVFTQLIETIGDRKALKKIPGIVFKENGEIVNTGMSPFIEYLDQLPFPARQLTPYQKYSSLLAKRMPVTTMFTSRGCPYRCAFCDRPNLGKKFRAHSARYVVDEMEACIDLGIHEFLIYDDTFTIHKQRVVEICDEILKRKLDISWDIRARIDTVSEEMLRKLKNAGCERIHYGVEAGTEKILKILNKGITLEQVWQVFRMTKKVGISTLGYFMIGAPMETREDILQTIAFARKLPADFVHITILTPFPATRIYQDGLQQGLFKEDFWQQFAAKPTSDFQPRFWDALLSREELEELLKYAYKSFYTRPGYIVKELFKIRSFHEFQRKMKAGLKVLGMK